MTKEKNQPDKRKCHVKGCPKPVYVHVKLLNSKEEWSYSREHYPIFSEVTELIVATTTPSGPFV